MFNIILNSFPFLTVMRFLNQRIVTELDPELLITFLDRQLCIPFDRFIKSNNIKINFYTMYSRDVQLHLSFRVQWDVKQCCYRIIRLISLYLSCSIIELQTVRSPTF